ncbi:MAG: cadherin-like beta sandwich domain-containing protein [Bacilli bacterium]|nr:cadherin-like beta sandwich domain-containing protein [Bacilli bacterium]
MKFKRIFILSILGLMTAITRVDAANNFVISAPSSAKVNTNFTVSVKHKGDTIGSLQMEVGITNAECSVASTCSGGVANCKGGSCLMSFNLPNGLKESNNIITLSCHSSGGVAKFNASVANRDAWDVEGMKQLSISSTSKSVTIEGTVATTKKTTTQTTISKRPTTGRTTKSSTKSTTKSSTTKKTPTTKSTKSTDSKTTKNTTMKMPFTSEAISTTTEDTTTTEETTTSTTTVYVPDDLKLRELKIVGYNINFKPNLSSYTINVDEEVNELYIIASPADEQTEIETVGLVDIENKDFIQIRVFNENAHHEINYKINIRRNKKNDEPFSSGNFFSNSFKLITFSMLGVIFFLIIFFTIKGFLNKNKHKEKEGISNHEYTNEDTEELIPKSEEELKMLFDELDKEHQK